MQTAGRASAGAGGTVRRGRITERGPIVVIVDQLEELFTLCTDGRERRAFLDLLAALPRGNLLVFGVRSDFYTQCASHPWLRGVLQQDQILLGPMRETELREAILLPLRALDVEMEMEPGLVELLLRDLGMAETPESADEHQAGDFRCSHTPCGRAGNNVTVMC